MLHNLPQLELFAAVAGLLREGAQRAVVAAVAAAAAVRARARVAVRGLAAGAGQWPVAGSLGLHTALQNSRARAGQGSSHEIGEMCKYLEKS